MVQEFSKCSEPGAGEQSTDAPGGSLEGQRSSHRPPRLPPLQHVRHVLGAFQDRRVRAGSEGFLTAGHRGETSQGKEVFCVLRKG